MPGLPGDRGDLGDEGPKGYAATFSQAINGGPGPSGLPGLDGDPVR